jgi:hypothetical protein
MELRSVARALAGTSLALAIGALAPRGARAQEPKPAPGAGGGGPACVLKGNHPGPKGAQVFDAASGGRAVAAFTGAFVPMALSEIPSDPAAGRARIATSSGSASFRIDGWVSPSALDVFTTRDVPVAPGHVWISGAQKIKLVQAASGALTAEIVVPGTGGQAARATAPCDAFSLQPVPPTAMEVPGNGRGYLSKAASLDLSEEPGGAAVFTLKTAGAQHLFWSTESREGFVHLRTRGTLTIDAWARARDLEPLKQGETMDQLIPPTTVVTGLQMQLATTPRAAKATHDTPLRARRDEKERPIGVVESGAEVYLMETTVGWVNVLPKGLGLLPADEGGFWIPEADAPK